MKSKLFFSVLLTLSLYTGTIFTGNRTADQWIGQITMSQISDTFVNATGNVLKGVILAWCWGELINQITSGGSKTMIEQLCDKLLRGR